MAVTCVDESTRHGALAPLKDTFVVVSKFVPVIVTNVPALPLVGEKPVIVGGWITTKLLVVVAVPPVVVTVIGPVVAPVGTTAFTCVADMIV
jgi:hypothetical protein